jgi:hypothetical protein
LECRASATLLMKTGIRSGKRANASVAESWKRENVRPLRLL